MDVSNLISRLFGTLIQIGFAQCHLFIYFLNFFVHDTIDSKSTTQFLIQLFIVLGKYHIHVKKWAKAKPNCEHFDTSSHNIKTK